MGVELPKGIKAAERTIPGPGDFLSADDVKKLTPQKVIDNLRAAKPLIASYRRQSELRRRPMDEAWNAIRMTGYFYLMMPKEWGGLEATYDEMLDATFAICEADPALGWLASFTIMNPRSAAPFSEKALLEMYGDGKTFGHGKYTILNTLVAPRGEAKKVEGGWLVSGRWSWGTTVQQSDWISVMANYTKEDGTRAIGTYLFPAGEDTILDVWTADALIATGTHHVACKDVFVPDYRFVPAGLASVPWMEIIRSRYSYDIFKADIVNALSTTIAVALVGMARGAVERYTQLLKEWTKRGDEGREADKQTSQIRLAHVHAKVQACEIQLRDVARRTYASVNEPNAVQQALGEKLGCEFSFVAHSARDAIMEISKGLGTSAHYVDEPMSQFIRDAIVGSTHRAVNWDALMTGSGRALLGLPPLPVNPNARSH